MASDYRSRQHINSPFVSAPQEFSNDKNQQSVKSYANVIKSDVFPTKEQAIIIDAIDGSSLKEYINSISSLVNPTNIRFVSRISKNRICMYLANTELVNKLVENNSTITVGNEKLTIRPLLTKNKRIVLSNVCPIIPHNVLEEKFKSLNIRMASKITFLKAGLSEPGFSHILSFRRQVYVNPDDANSIPESMEVEFDGTKYWIYLSTDLISCFICKSHGHIARHCPENISNCNNLEGEIKVAEANEEPISTTNQPASKLVDDDSLPATYSDNNVDDTSGVITDLVTPDTYAGMKGVVGKRQLSTTDSLCSEESRRGEMSSFPCLPTNKAKNVTTSDERTNHKKKKIKKDLLEESLEKTLDEQLLPIKEFLSSSNNLFPLDYIRFKNLLERTKGVNKITDIVSDFSTDFSGLIGLFTTVYPLLKDRAIKTRVTKIKKKLQSALSMEIDTENSTAPSDNEFVGSTEG